MFNFNIYGLGNVTKKAASVLLAVGLLLLGLGILVIVLKAVFIIIVATIIFMMALWCISMALRMFMQVYRGGSPKCDDPEKAYRKNVRIHTDDGANDSINDSVDDY